MVPEIEGVTDRKFRHFGLFFCLFSSLTTWKIKILTLKKNIWRYYHSTHLHHKWQSLWCMVPEIRSKIDNFLSFWTVFCSYTPLWTQKIKVFKKWKKYLKILSIYKHKWQSYDAWFLRYGVQWTEFFCHFGLFFTLFLL